MRLPIFIFSAIAAIAVFNTGASAADGCSYDYNGQYYCAPGARPGVPYYGPGYGYGYAPQPYYNQPYYGQRYYRRRDDGAAIALGIAGAAIGAIAAGQSRRYYRGKRYRYR